MKNKTVRTHDSSVYLSENRYENPKELFIQIVELIRCHAHEGLQDNSERQRLIADVGCAAGEFAYFLKKSFPNDKIIGYELLPELVQKAQTMVGDVEFFVGSLLDSKLIEENSSDVVTCTGVLPLFDEFEVVISNLLRWVRPGGHIYLHSLFNPYPVDVFIQYNKSADYGNGVLETGWNMFSRQSVSSWLEGRQDVFDVTWHDFTIAIDLERQEDVIRSWTVKDENKERIITNGLSFIQPHAVLEIVGR